MKVYFYTQLRKIIYYCKIRFSNKSIYIYYLLLNYFNKQSGSSNYKKQFETIMILERTGSLTDRAVQIANLCQDDLLLHLGNARGIPRARDHLKYRLSLRRERENG